MNENDCAFPNPSRGFENNKGLTKRELIAAMAMQGLCSNPGIKPGLNVEQFSVRMADALLAELEKSKK